VARRLVERGARNLLLVGRTALPDRERASTEAVDPEAAARVAFVRELESAGAVVDVVAADVADRAAMAAVVDRAGVNLRGVVHAAGVADIESLHTISDTRFEAVFRPKAGGAAVLDALTAHLPLDFFVLFSSTTGVWGSAGLAHYCAANAYLDGLAVRRRSHGRTACSVAWGAWSLMRGATSLDLERVRRSGLVPMDPEAALDAFERAIALDVATVVVAAVDWPALKGVYEMRRTRPLLGEVGAVAIAPRPSARSGALASELAAAPPFSRASLVSSHIRAHAADVIGLDSPASLDPQQGLFDLGLDSLMALELKHRLETAFGVTLSPAAIFTHPTIDALAAHLLTMIDARQPAEAAPPAGAVSAESQHGPPADGDVAARLDAELALAEELLGQDLE
jgi:aryl carrier-like protein